MTVTVSLLKLSVIEVAADPVVMAMPLSDASPVVTESVPVSAAALMLPDQVGDRRGGRAAIVRIVIGVSADASTVTTSPVPLALIEVAAEPVVMPMVLSAALPVVTVSAPLRAPALIPRPGPVTVSAAEPAMSAVSVLSQRGRIDRDDVAPAIAVIEVAAEPVVTAIPLSVASPVVTESAPVREPAVTSPTRPVTVPRRRAPEASAPRSGPNARAVHRQRHRPCHSR